MALTAQEIFAETVQSLPPDEQFRLAALILQELFQSGITVVDRRDTWSEQDKKDLTTAWSHWLPLYSTGRHFIHRHNASNDRQNHWIAAKTMPR